MITLCTSTGHGGTEVNWGNTGEGYHIIVLEEVFLSSARSFYRLVCPSVGRSGGLSYLNISQKISKPLLPLKGFNW